FHAAAATAMSAVFEGGDLTVDRERDDVSVLCVRDRFLKSVVVEASRRHVRGGGSIVSTWIEIDALAFVAAVVDAFVSAAPREHLVRERRPPFARVLHPFAAVKCSALGRTSAIRI